MSFANEVAFHFNAPDKVHYAARLVRKAATRGNRLLVLAEEEGLHVLDAALWTLDPGSFIAHAMEGDPPSVKRHSPILLASSQPQDFAADVLVNLRHSWVEGWMGFSKVVEVVTREDGDRMAARERWRRYRQQGVEPVHHDLKTRTL